MPIFIYDGDQQPDRAARIRESKRAYMRRWRAANPELAAQKNREDVAAHRARKRAFNAKVLSAGPIAIVPLTDEERAASRKVTPVFLAGRCLTCGFVSKGHRLLFRDIAHDMRRHFRAEHPGMWDDPTRPKGTYLYEQVLLNADGDIVPAP